MSRAGSHGVKMIPSAGAFDATRETRLTLLARLLAEKKLAQQSDMYARSAGTPITHELPPAGVRRLNINPKRQRNDDMTPAQKPTNQKRKPTEESSDRAKGKRSSGDEVRVILTPLVSNADKALFSFRVVR